MARRRTRPLWPAALTLAMLLWQSPGAHAIVYCNITTIETKQLRNGVQILLKADGILFRDYHASSQGGATTNRFTVSFSNARNQTGKTFMDVSMFPVSHLELAVPPDAKEGIGVTMTVVTYEPCPVDASWTRDRTGYIITVRSTRTLETTAPSFAPDTGAAKELSVSVVNGLVSASAENVDIHRLLGEIARQTGANLAVDDAVQASASLNLRDLPVPDLFRTIASAYGLALSEVDGVYMFSQGVPQDLSAYRLSGTASFPMRFTRAQAASGLLPTFLYSYLHVNEEQNAVVVTAPQQMLDKIKADLEAVDVAPPQILIEAIAVEFTNTDDLDKVLRTARGDVTGRTTGGEEGVFGEPETWMETDSRSGLLSYSNIGQLPRDFEAHLRALETDQRARIHAAPRLAIMNGHEANIFIGVRRFIRVEYIVFSQTIEKIQGVDVGVKLRVRPLTGGAGEITLTISPEGTEVSNVSELDPRTGLPVLSTRQTGTTVRVTDGETVMIGGLSQRQHEDRVTKIPVLGDLPLIGGLFRSRSRSAVNSELVVFITPHTLTPEGRLADTAREQSIRDRFLAEPEGAP